MLCLGFTSSTKGESSESKDRTWISNFDGHNIFGVWSKWFDVPFNGFGFYTDAATCRKYAIVYGWANEWGVPHATCENN